MKEEAGDGIRCVRKKTEEQQEEDNTRASISEELAR
jgi:hypothetical protein